MTGSAGRLRRRPLVIAAAATLAVLLSAAIALLLVFKPFEPDMRWIAAQAEQKLQAQLDGDFTPGIARVQRVDLVNDGSRNFNGSATVATIDRSLMVPVHVTSDGKTTVIAIDDGTESKLSSAIRQAVSVLRTKTSDFILDSRFRSIFPADMKRDVRLFSERLGLPQDVTEDAQYYFGEGCEPHNCVTDQAAWVVDKATGHLIAALMHVALGKPGQDVKVNIVLYGKPAGETDLPGPLEKWKSNVADSLDSAAKENGGVLLDAMRGVQQARQAEAANSIGH